MDMKIQVISAGIGIPKTKFGWRAGSGLWMGFKVTPNSKPVVYGVFEKPGIGDKNGQLVFGYVKTEWFPLTSPIKDICCLARTKVDMGLALNFNAVDFTLKMIGPTGDILFTLSKLDIKASGLMLTKYEARGELIPFPAPTEGW